MSSRLDADIRYYVDRKNLEDENRELHEVIKFFIEHYKELPAKFWDIIPEKYWEKYL
jgi:hypothetical protein